MRLRLRALLIAGVCLPLVGAGVATVGIVRQDLLLKSVWRDHAATIARDMAAAVETVVAVRDVEETQRLVRAIDELEVEVVHAVVRDDRGHILGRSGAPTPDAILQRSDIYFEGQVVGNVELRLSSEPLRAARAAAIRSAITAAAAVTIPLLALIVLVLSRTVVRPLEQLGAAVRRMGGGQHPDVARQILVRRDEIGELARRLVDSANDLEQRQSELVHAEKLATLGTLAAAVGHEINNPAAAVLANLEYLAGGTADGESAEAIADSVDAVKRIADIAHQLRAFARSDAGESHAEVGPAIDSAMTLARGMLRDLRAEVEVAAGLPPAHIAPGPLGQAILNLVVNAADALAGRGHEGLIRVTARRCGGRVIVTVADNGPGIAPEILPRIFEPFFTTKPRGRGTGLGLAITRDIARHCGGDLEVSTAVGAGTEFRLILDVEEAAAGKRATVPAPAVVGPERTSVLVIDDEILVRRAVARTLAKRFEVTAMSGGADAIRHLAGGASPGLILCDVVMPKVTGVDVAQWIEQHRPELMRRFFYITGGGIGSDLRAAIEARPDRVLWKPIDAADLMRRAAEAAA